jgi:hypothetical protein
MVAMTDSDQEQRSEVAERAIGPPGLRIRWVCMRNRKAVEWIPGTATAWYGTIAYTDSGASALTDANPVRNDSLEVDLRIDVRRRAEGHDADDALEALTDAVRLNIGAPRSPLRMYWIYGALAVSWNTRTGVLARHAAPLGDGFAEISRARRVGVADTLGEADTRALTILRPTGRGGWWAP